MADKTEIFEKLERDRNAWRFKKHVKMKIIQEKAPVARKNDKSCQIAHNKLIIYHVYSVVCTWRAVEHLSTEQDCKFMENFVSLHRIPLGQKFINQDMHPKRFWVKCETNIDEKLLRCQWEKSDENEERRWINRPYFVADSLIRFLVAAAVVGLPPSGFITFWMTLWTLVLSDKEISEIFDDFGMKKRV